MIKTIDKFLKYDFVKGDINKLQYFADNISEKLNLPLLNIEFNNNDSFNNGAIARFDTENLKMFVNIDAFPFLNNNIKLKLSLLESLIHEPIHCKQFLEYQKGDLSYKNILIPFSGTPFYLFQKTEIEAHEETFKILESFSDKFPILKNFIKERREDVKKNKKESIKILKKLGLLKPFEITDTQIKNKINFLMNNKENFLKISQDISKSNDNIFPTCYEYNRLKVSSLTNNYFVNGEIFKHTNKWLCRFETGKTESNLALYEFEISNNKCIISQIANTEISDKRTLSSVYKLNQDVNVLLNESDKVKMILNFYKEETGKTVNEIVVNPISVEIKAKDYEKIINNLPNTILSCEKTLDLKSEYNKSRLLNEISEVSFNNNHNFNKEYLEKLLIINNIFYDKNKFNEICNNNDFKNFLRMYFNNIIKNPVKSFENLKNDYSYFLKQKNGKDEDFLSNFTKPKEVEIHTTTNRESVEKDDSR